MILTVNIFRGDKYLSENKLSMLSETYTKVMAAAAPALQEEVKHFGFERFKNRIFFQIPLFTVIIQYEFSCLNYQCPFP